MRYDTPIYFQKVVRGKYDSTTGNYIDDDINEVSMLSSVTDTRTETMNLVYGEIRENSKTVRLQNHYDNTFDTIRIDSKKYRVDFRRKLRMKEVFILSEVQ